MKKAMITASFFVLAIVTLQPQESDFSKLSGPYLGQKPPGTTPEIFAPGIISLEANFECCRAVSPEAREFFFVRQVKSGEKIFRTVEGENGWTSPMPIPYSDKAFQYTPFISPAGDKFLFMAGDGKPKREGGPHPEVWMLTRNGTEWSVPRLVGATIGGARPFYISMARSGALYFSCVDQDGIYRSEFKGGQCSPAERLPDEINHLERISHPYIAPDEDFIIVDAKSERPDHHNDLYISFHRNDGTWTKAVNMGNTINSAGHEICPSVSNDGKYIFFGRLLPGKKTDIFWVSAKVIEDLRPRRQMGTSR